MDLLLFGSIFRKPTERDWALSTTNSEGDKLNVDDFAHRQKILSTLSVLVQLISSSIVAPLDEKEDIVKTCKLHAKRYLDKSNEHIPVNEKSGVPTKPVSCKIFIFFPKLYTLLFNFPKLYTSLFNLRFLISDSQLSHSLAQTMGLNYSR